GSRKYRYQTGWLTNSCNKQQALHHHHWAETRAGTDPNATDHGTQTQQDWKNNCRSTTQ
ncbi:Hypothetical predicted protein, partial [Pelobates cultripes]